MKCKSKACIKVDIKRDIEIEIEIEKAHSLLKPETKSKDTERLGEDCVWNGGL